MKLVRQRPGFGSILDHEHINHVSSGFAFITNSDNPIELAATSMNTDLNNERLQILRTREVVLDRGPAAFDDTNTVALGFDNDEQPLRQEREWERVGYHGSVSYTVEIIGGK